MPGGPQPAPRTREGSRGTALSPARPDCTPGTGCSDKPLPGPLTTLRPQPATQRPALAVPGAEPAVPRSLPPCRRRSRRSRWSARSEARTNDLEVRQDDGHTPPRGRPEAKIRWSSRRARRAPHKPRKRPAEPLDTKRHSFGAAAESWRVHSLCVQIRSICTHARPAIWRLPRRGGTGRGSATAADMAMPPAGVPGVALAL